MLLPSLRAGPSLALGINSARFPRSRWSLGMTGQHCGIAGDATPVLCVTDCSAQGMLGVDYCRLYTGPCIAHNDDRDGKMRPERTSTGEPFRSLLRGRIITMSNSRRIRTAIVGVGNCASSLIQGIEYYRTAGEQNTAGIMHYQIGNYRPQDIEVVAAFDIDQRKVGRDIAEAIFAPPNCTKRFCNEVPRKGIMVTMGKILDGVAEHMAHYEPDSTFVASS